VLPVLVDDFFAGHVPECDCLVVRAAEKLAVVDAEETPMHRSKNQLNVSKCTATNSVSPLPLMAFENSEQILIASIK
jgi:hypothetical protein